jgi:hypothetical protein
MEALQVSSVLAVTGIVLLQLITISGSSPVSITAVTPFFGAAFMYLLQDNRYEVG